MVTRWIIRGLFIFPILLCVSGWGWSYLSEVHLTYLRHNGGSLDLVRGYVVLDWQQRHGSPGAGWRLDVHPLGDGGGQGIDSQLYMPPMFQPFRWRCLGFGMGGFQQQFYAGPAGPTPPLRTTDYWLLRIPFWFATALLAIVLFFAWRKTRPR